MILLSTMTWVWIGITMFIMLSILVAILDYNRP